MELTKEQNDKIRTELTKIFARDVPWAAEQDADGKCEKVVTAVATINQEQLDKVYALGKETETLIFMTGNSRHISIKFSAV